MLNGCKAGKKHREIFEIFQKYFMKYFRAKNFMKFYITTYLQYSTQCSNGCQCVLCNFQ